MFADTIAAAIDAAHPSKLDELSRAIWQGLQAGALNDDDAQRLAEVIHARRTAAKAAGERTGAGRQEGRGRYPFRKPQRPPVRSVAIERRRRLAYGGPLPPNLAWHFTLGESAVLGIIASEVRERGFCALTLGAIAARAGCCRELVRRAIRKAERELLITTKERRRPGQVNLPNVISITSKEWLAWISRGPRRESGPSGKGIGPTKVAPTDTRVSFRSKERTGRWEHNPETRRKKEPDRAGRSHAGRS